MDKKYINYDHNTGDFLGFCEKDTPTGIEVSEAVYKKLLFSNKICKIKIDHGTTSTSDLEVENLVEENEIPAPPPSVADLFKSKIAGRDFKNWSRTEKDLALEALLKMAHIL